MNERETRCLDAEASEIRMETDDTGRPVIRGVALRYGSLSTPLKDSKGRPFRERFAPGSFSRALATGADVRGLVNHNKDLVLGRTLSGTLVLNDAPDALRYEIYPSNSAIAQHYVEAISRGDMSGTSFRFYKLRDAWSGAGEATIRDILEADIDDISVVTYPAYSDTEAAIRSIEDHCRPLPRQDPALDREWVRLRLAEAGE